MEPTPGTFLEPFLHAYCSWLYTDSYWWTALGFVANGLFGSRFIFQWLASERKHELIVPNYFWHLSFWGSVLNLIYALHLDNAPLIFGVIALPFIYGRNLILLGRKQSNDAQVSVSESAALPSVSEVSWTRDSVR